MRTVDGKGKRMDVKEFVESGFLREANRNFFHPLGLALFVSTNADANFVLGGILDGRDDPEGFIFDSANAEGLERSKRFAEIWKERTTVRQARLGFIVQPISDEVG